MFARKKVILIGVVIVVLIGVAFGVWWFKFRPTSVTPDDQQTQSDWRTIRISELTPDELQKRAQKDTGYTTEQLKNQTPTESTFKDFAQAYTAAQILAATGEYAKSVAAYKIAEQKAGQGDLSEDFYNDFSHVADRAGDYALGTQLLQKEITYVNSQSISAEEKQSIIDKLNAKIETRKAEGLS